MRTGGGLVRLGQRAQPGPHLARNRGLGARRQLGFRQVADPPQQIVGGVAVADLPLGIQRLQLGFDVVQRRRIQQRRQLFLAQQLAQQLPIQRQRLRPPLGQRRVPLVHVRGDVGEGQRPRERGGRAGLDLDDAHLALADRLQEPLQRRQIEDVLQALPDCLEDDREAGVPQRRRHQVLRLQALRPQRRARVRPPARQQQRARRVLAEVRREQRRVRELPQHQLFDLLGIRHQRRQLGRVVQPREPQHDAVVAPDRLHLEPGGGPQARLQRQRPGGVHARAERRQDADAEVAQLVAKPFDRDVAIGGQRAGRLALVGDVAPQVAGRAPFQRRLFREPALGGALGLVAQLAHERAQRAPQLQRASRPLAAPERHLAGLARGGRDDHPVARDLRDAPGGRAQQERLADARLVHHLLVQLADARAVRAQVHGVKAAVGDGAAAEDRHQPRVAPGRQPIRGAVPGQPRPQIRELVRRVAARQHVQRRRQHVARERRVRVGALDDRLQRRDRAAPPRARLRRAQSARRRLRGRWRRSPRSAAPARPAGCAARAWARRRPRSSGAPRPPPPADPPGAWGRCARCCARRPGARRARCVAGRAPRCPAIRSAPPDRRPPCRCPAPASWSRPGRAAARPSASPRSLRAARARRCRGGRAPAPRPPDR